jgi:hypothetical protein
MAHLNLGLLAYWIVNTVRFQLNRFEETAYFEPFCLKDSVETRKR